MTKELSAGGIIAKRVDQEIYILLVEHKNQTYVFPKGHVEQRESLKKAATREINEETGLTNIAIGEKLGIIKRTSLKPSGELVKKDIVMFYASVENYNNFGKGEEVIKWFTIKNAFSVLRYKEDREFLKSNQKNIIKNIQGH